MRRGEEVKDDFESRFSTNHHCCSLFRFNRPAASIYMYNIVMPTDLCYLLPFVQLQTKPREDDALFSELQLHTLFVVCTSILSHNNILPGTVWGIVYV